MAPEMYRVVAAGGAVVRKEFHLTSQQCGQLRKGETIEALEVRRPCVLHHVARRTCNERSGPCSFGRVVVIHVFPYRARSQVKSDVTKQPRVQFKLTRKYGEGTVSGWAALTVGGKTVLEKVVPPTAPAHKPAAAKKGRAAWASSSDSSSGESESESSNSDSDSDSSYEPPKAALGKAGKGKGDTAKKGAAKGDKFRAMVAQNVRKDYHSTSSQCGEALHSDPWRAALRQRVGRGLRR